MRLILILVAWMILFVAWIIFNNCCMDDICCMDYVILVAWFILFVAWMIFVARMM